MKKDIKDYLHLYLGCEIQGNYMDEPCKGYLTGIGEYQAEIQFIVNGNAEEEPAYNRYSEVKPILRTLSDMTEDEKLWWFNSVNDGKRKLVESEWVSELNGKACEPHWTLWTDDYKIGRMGYTVGINNSFKPEQFFWLLSKHFDLFGLIEAGMAIDKTKQIIKLENEDTSFKDRRS